ncbi:hypothetical protein [Haliangium sp.]|uniref:hypothetical protein n=1 Tax=Haliangium sp. TaxID=2663208 RepID=UPI003D0ADCC6
MNWGSWFLLLLLSCLFACGSCGSVNGGRSPLSARDVGDGELTGNYAGPTLRGIGWHCFEIQSGDGTVGRCYRLLATCKTSRQSWAGSYAVSACDTERRRYASCLNGRDTSSDEDFGICYTTQESCRHARTELRGSAGVQFVTECVVLE